MMLHTEDLKLIEEIVRKVIKETQEPDAVSKNAETKAKKKEKENA